jgi:hypothetical protein
MDGIRPTQFRSSSGTVTVEDLPATTLASGRSPPPGVTVRRSRYTWRPSGDTSRQLPSHFRLSLDCAALPDGVRRFVPCAGAAPFILQASVGGQALLATRAGLSREQRFSYHAARLFYQQAHRLREHFGRTFGREQDLYTPQGGRIGQDDAHVLPAHLGLDGKGRGEPWKPADVVRRGRQEAAAAGYANPDEATCIRLGLHAAARRNPVERTMMSDAESLPLVRLALFDLGPSCEPSDESLVDKVQERLFPALERHIDDDTESFNRWFFESTDNLVHLVAKKKGGGGKLAREAVRQAYQELAFRSFTYVGDCVHVQMRAFARALPEPLNAEERPFFDPLYQKQPRLGGLPLIMLQDRLEFLRETVIDLWDDPRDRGRMGALLRMLQYYGEMAAKKREADRRYKRQSRPRNKQGRNAKVLALDPARDAAPRPTSDLFQDIAGCLREQRRASCRCGVTRDWRARLVAQTAGGIVVEDVCGTCGQAERFEVTNAHFEKVGKGLLPDDDYEAAT